MRWGLCPVLALVWLCCVSGVKADEPLTADALLKNSIMHAPAILMEEAKIEQAKAAQMRERGRFDATIEQQFGGYADGFYDGKQFDSRLVKPLPFMGSEVYAGYRESNGVYPVYEEEYATNDGGEFMFGATMSLLRNRVIDDDQASILEADIDMLQAQARQLVTLLNVQRDALIAYWRWVVAGRKLDVYRDLLSIADTRQDQLRKKVDEGNIADIYLTENKQYLVRRQAQLNEAERRYDVAAYYLSLYYRDDTGVPLVPDIEQLPKEIEVEPITTAQGAAKDILENRPEMQLLTQEVARYRALESLGRNEMLPKADVSFVVADDQGEGAFQRDETEMKLMMQVSIPVQQRRARGMVAEASAKLKQLRYEQQLQLERFTIQLNEALTNMKRLRKFINFAEQEKELAYKMREAEAVRFENGDSDFFTLNAREEDQAQARIRYLEAKERYLMVQTSLYALLADAEALHLNN